jgi:hypothetical protein
MAFLEWTSVLIMALSLTNITKTSFKIIVFAVND